MRLVAYGGVSTLSTTCAVLAAFRQRANFYAAAVYLSKSNACMMILCNFGIFCTILLAKALQSIFFGQLRLAEIERVNDRLWFTISETLLALAMFRDEFDTSFVVLFISLIFVKVFHWLAAYRVEWMDQTTSPPGKLFHARMISVLSIIWITDMLLIAYATESVLLHGPSVVLMFEMEYIIMQVTCLSIICKYILNSYAHYRAQEHWEGKSTYQFYIELATDFLKLLTYIGFLSLTLTFHGLPINVLRDVYYTFRSFVTKCNNLVRFRQATRNMNERYPNATRAEMESLADKTCIICREDMEFRDEHEPAAGDAGPNTNGNGAGAAAGPNDTPKKLVCGHIFHFHCLRSWLERQQTCPTCRRPVIQAPPATQVAPQNPNAAVNRAFAAAMAAAGAGPPAIPPAIPGGAGRAAGAPGTPLGLPAAQAGGPAAAPVGAGEGNLIGTRPDGSRHDFNQRMREFEQRLAAATTSNPGGAAAGPPGTSSYLRQQAQTRNNPLLQFDLSSHSGPSSSRPLAGRHHVRLRTSPGSRPNSPGFPTFPSARIERKNSQTSPTAAPSPPATAAAKPPTTTSALPPVARAQPDLPAEPSSLAACPEDPPTATDDTDPGQAPPAEPCGGAGDSVQAGSLAELRIDFGGPAPPPGPADRARLPCLIPLFDHRASPVLLPDPQTILEEYQQKVAGRPAAAPSCAGDRRSAELLEIQSSLAECCARLARLMGSPAAGRAAVDGGEAEKGKGRSE
ncbi:hypothetical protein PtA15_10A53 [Puccinia triticina]|uniref:RING-type E3 ubiquitin transferase n=1 Tax=Puccinia triticina TaxID=208348 RepID=A0ABY7CTM6_9BASI|nr:uncharacterized protein PtA15_10A53 [Puccinia triticina]WAQ88634.1 hypothetical protein PtA15_10A53 [Puccinia triticina]